MNTHWLKRIFLSKAYAFENKKIDYSKWDKLFVPIKDGKIQCLIRKQVAKTGKLVILVHPYHTQGKEYFLETNHPKLYYDLGFNVVVFDQNGFGQSDDFGFDFHQDLLKVAYYFKNVLKANQIVAHGISFGAATLLTSLQHRHPFEKAIIENCMDEVSNYFKVRSPLLYRLLLLSEKISKRIQHRNQYYRIAKGVQNIDRVILIYSKDDELTTPAMGLKLQSNFSIPCDYYLLKGGHMASIDADPQAYSTLISSYISN